MARDGDNKEKTIRCSFCNKAQSEVKTLIAGPGVYICDECIDLCRSIVEEESVKIPYKTVCHSEYAKVSIRFEILRLCSE